MPRIARPLTARQAEADRPPAKNSRRIVVGGVPGLILRVQPTGKGRSFVLRGTLNGKRVERPVGSFPALSLAEARAKAADMREMMARGIDPRGERARPVLTFEQAAAKWQEAMHDAHSNNPKYQRARRGWLERYIYPHIADMKISEIEPKDVIRVLAPIWREKHSTADRVRATIAEVIDWTTSNGFRSGDNPAQLSLVKAGLPKVDDLDEQKRPSVALKDVKRFYAALQKIDTLEAKALRLIALTAVRSNEAVGARWQEFDLDTKIWTIPKERLGKRGRKVKHTIPLTPAMIELLESIPRDSEMVFPSVQGKALVAIMKELDFKDPESGLVSVPHGLRATFSGWLNEVSDHPPEMAEYQLHHKVGTKVAQSYARGSMVERRREMLKSYGAFLGA